MLASFSGQLRPECLNPAQHGAVGHVDAPFGQQLHHARAGQWVAQVPAHTHQNHVGRPAITRKSRGGTNREVSSAVCAGKALATVAVIAVTRDDEMLAVWTGGHPGRRYQYQTTSQTPMNKAALSLRETVHRVVQCLVSKRRARAKAAARRLDLQKPLAPFGVPTPVGPSKPLTPVQR